MRRRSLPPLPALATLALALVALAAVRAAPPPPALDSTPIGLAPALARALPTDDTPRPPGDGSSTPEYRLCVQSRYDDVCGPDGVDDGVTGRGDRGWPRDLPLGLRLMRWDCLSDTRYRCTHTVTNAAVQRTHLIRHQALLQAQAAQPNAGIAAVSADANARARAVLDALPPVRKQMVKYDGHWVFIRVGGMEQPLAALGMALAFLINLIALVRLRAGTSAPSPPALPSAFPIALLYTFGAFTWVLAAVGGVLGSMRHTPLNALAEAVGLHAALLTTFWQGLARMCRWGPAGKTLPPRQGAVVAQNARAFRIGCRLFVAMLVIEGLLVTNHLIGTSFFAQCNKFLAPVTWLIWFSLTFRPYGLTGSVPLSVSGPALHSDEVELVGGSAVPDQGRRAVPRRLRTVLLLALVGAWADWGLDFPPLHRTLDLHAAWALTLPLVAIMWHTALAADATSVVTSCYWVDPSRARVQRPGSPTANGWAAGCTSRALATGTALVDRGCARAYRSISTCISLLSVRLAQYAAQRRAADPNDPLAALFDPRSASAAAMALADSVGLTKALPELKALGG